MQFPVQLTARNANGATRTSRYSRGGSRRGEIALWTIQAALAAIFLFAGASKFVMAADTLTKDTNLPLAFIRFIGACEILGAFGLILPGILRVHRELTPLAAAGLVIIMVGATSITVATLGVAAAAFPFLVGILALTVASKRSPFAVARTK